MRPSVLVAWQRGTAVSSDRAPNQNMRSTLSGPKSKRMRQKGGAGSTPTPGGAKQSAGRGTREGISSQRPFLPRRTFTSSSPRFAAALFDPAQQADGRCSEAQQTKSYFTPVTEHLVPLCAKNHFLEVRESLYPNPFVTSSQNSPRRSPCSFMTEFPASES